MRRILVTGAGGPAAINFVKSLRIAPEKFFIVGTDTNKFHLELAALDKAFLVPACTKPNYLDKMNELIAKEKIELVHPQPDVEVDFFSENRGKVNAKLFLPSKEAVKICHDKVKLNSVLSKKGVPVPEAYPIKTEEDIKTAISALGSKNKKIWIRAVRGAGSRASLPIKEEKHAIMWIDYWAKMKGVKDFMASEFLPGKEFAFQSLWKNGNLVTSAARERLEYIFANLTASGQSSSPSVAKSVHRSDVNEIATKAIKAVDKKATGIFCVDLKENSKGIPNITEINLGRFFTTNNFFSEAGSNMPYYYIKMAYGEELPELPKYNAVPKDLYWIRLIDGGYKLVKEGEWKATKI